MTRITSISAFVFVSLCVPFGCGAEAPSRVQVDDVERESKEAIDAARKKASEFVAKSEKTIARLEKQAEEWRSEAQNLELEARAASRKEIAELEVKTAEARKRLKEFKGDSEAAWTDFTRGAESALEELQEAYRRAASRFDDEH